MNRIKGSQDENLRISYAKFSDKIERMSKLFYLVQVKIGFAVNMLPTLLISMVNYYILDMEDESFLLTFPSK